MHFPITVLDNKSVSNRCPSSDVVAASYRPEFTGGKSGSAVAIPFIYEYRCSSECTDFIRNHIF